MPLGDAAQRIALLQNAMADDIAARLTGFPSVAQFIPYIQQHEFEALLFSDPSAFAAANPGEPSIVGRLTQILAQFANPEDIDNGPEIAPSKRIGLSAMRRECPGFDRWVSRLEALSS